jgi:hypothetical protein
VRRDIPANPYAHFLTNRIVATAPRPPSPSAATWRRYFLPLFTFALDTRLVVLFHGLNFFPPGLGGHVVAAVRARGLVVPQPQKRPRSAGRRYQRDKPNELWCSDRFGWRMADGGWRMVPRLL